MSFSIITIQISAVPVLADLLSLFPLGVGVFHLLCKLLWWRLLLLHIMKKRVKYMKVHASTLEVWTIFTKLLGMFIAHILPVTLIHR